MPLSSSLVKIRGALPAAGQKRDPRAMWKVVLGVLLVANIAAFFLLVRPPGGSLADLDAQLQSLRRQAVDQRQAVGKSKALLAKMEAARAEQVQFMDASFMDRQTTSSTILTEIGQAAKEAGLSPKEHSFLIEAVDGSDTISMMTITANYEGSYGNLIRFVNLVDRSRRFLIMDSIQAAPLQERGKLAARFKINTFVREAAR
ncbi:MAG: hypothetical protein FJW39_07780 [Acidobacteria bacterium]|nr:hypothetical protein [Acidobacteriota bacterium]